MTAETQKIPGYKQTEIGVIPDDWDAKEINDLIINIASGNSKTTSELGDYPIYGSTGIIGYRNYPDYTGKRILIARVGANAGMVNMVAGKYCVSDNTLIVTYLSDIDIVFSYYQLVNSRLNKLTFGSGQPLVTGSQVKKLILPIPRDKQEQTAIANILSDIDSLIEKLEKMIEKKKMIKQGAMQELLTGKRRLPGFSGGWVSTLLKEIAIADWGNTTITKSSYRDNGYLAYSAAGPDGYVDWFEHESAGVVISAIGAQCGKTWLAKSKWTPIKNTIWFEANDDNIDIEFIFYLTSKPDFWPKGGQAQPFVSVTGVRNAQLLIPPLKAEQTAIARTLSDMDLEIEKLEARLNKYRTIKQGMMQVLLTGKIRLINKQ